MKLFELSENEIKVRRLVMDLAALLPQHKVTKTIKNQGIGIDRQQMTNIISIWPEKKDEESIAPRMRIYIGDHTIGVETQYSQKLALQARKVLWSHANDKPELTLVDNAISEYYMFIKRSDL